MSNNFNRRYHTHMARVVRVVDGDTLELAVDQGFKNTFKDSMRLHKVDTLGALKCF